MQAFQVNEAGIPYYEDICMGGTGILDSSYSSSSVLSAVVAAPPAPRYGIGDSLVEMEDEDSARREIAFVVRWGRKCMLMLQGLGIYIHRDLLLSQLN